MKLKEGSRVWLKANEDEGWPRQEAHVVFTSQMPWGVSVLVEVKPDDPGDDGLREVTLDQIEEDK